MFGICSWTDWPVNRTARLKNLRRQFHCIQGSTFLGCFNFGNFHTCCVAPVGVVTESVYDDVVYIRVESALTTAYHTSPKLLRTISWKSVKSEHESIIYDFLLASGSFCSLHDSNLVNWLEDSDARLFCKNKQVQLKNKPKIGNLTEKQAQHLLAGKFKKTKNYQENYIKNEGGKSEKTSPKWANLHKITLNMPLEVNWNGKSAIKFEKSNPQNRNLQKNKHKMQVNFN